MEILLVVLIAVLAIAALVVVLSLGDIRRYVRMRRM